MTTNVTKRPTRASDTDFARTIHHQAYREVVERQFGLWDEQAQDRFFDADWQSGAFEMLFCDDIPCGYACIEYREEDVFVRELVLLPEFQGRGIGSEILRGAMNRARQAGVPVRLGTCHMNRAADLYRRLGFRETGRTETHLLMEWHDERIIRS